MLEPLFDEVAGMNLVKKRLQRRCFPKNIQNYKNSFFIEHFRWLLLNGKMEKVKRSNLENSVNVQKQPPELLIKKLDEMGKM